MWKNIHVELKFLRLKFYLFIFSFFFLTCVSFFFFSSFFDVADLKTRSSTQRSIVQSTRSAHPAFNRPDRLFVLPLFFGAPDGSSICSSNRSCCVVLQNRVLETRFCFLEFESMKLKIYVTSYYQLTKWKSSL